MTTRLNLLYIELLGAHAELTQAIASQYGAVHNAQRMDKEIINQFLNTKCNQTQECISQFLICLNNFNNEIRNSHHVEHVNNIASSFRIMDVKPQNEGPFNFKQKSNSGKLNSPKSDTKRKKSA